VTDRQTDRQTDVRTYVQTCRNMSNHGRCCVWNVRSFSRCRSLQVDQTKVNHTSDRTPAAPWICPTRHNKYCVYSSTTWHSC